MFHLFQLGSKHSSDIVHVKDGREKCGWPAFYRYLITNLGVNGKSQFADARQRQLVTSSDPRRMDLFLPSDESRVLIIYTGGTIGMLVGDHGYVPEPYFLTETLRSQARFHDPLQDSLFSHSGSVQGFRQWSSSGTTSPSNANAADFAVNVSQQQLSTLLVRSSRPIDIPPPALSPMTTTTPPPRGTSQPRSIKDVYESRVPALVTPRSAVSGGVGKRIRYAVLEVSYPWWRWMKRLKFSYS